MKLNSNINRTFADLTKDEQQNILQKISSKRIDELNESLNKLDVQFWQCLKEGDLMKAQKVADIYNFIKEFIEKKIPVCPK